MCEGCFGREMHVSKIIKNLALALDSLYAIR